MVGNPRVKGTGDRFRVGRAQGETLLVSVEFVIPRFGSASSLKAMSTVRGVCETYARCVFPLGVTVVS